MPQARTHLRRLRVTIVSVALLTACDSNTPTTPTPAAAVATPTPATAAPAAPGDPAAPVALVSLDIAPKSLIGGEPLAATIAISGNAPAGGTVVTIATNSVDARPPVSVTVIAGTSSLTFPIVTRSVSNETEVTITASLRGESRSVQVRLKGNGGVAGGGGGGTPVVITGAPAGFIDIGNTLRAYALLAGSAATCTSSTVSGFVGVSPAAPSPAFLVPAPAAPCRV